MDDVATLMKQVCKITNSRTRRASEAELETLEDIGMPETAVAFYKRFAPSKSIEYGPCLWSLRELDRNYDVGPIYDETGLIPIGDTSSGSWLCLDPDALDKDGWPAIVVVSRGGLSKNSTAEKILSRTEPYCANLPALLQIMLDNHKKRLERDREREAED